MTRSRAGSLALSLLALSLSVPVDGQQAPAPARPDTTPTAVRVVSALESVRLGSDLRLFHAGQRAEGIYRDIRADTLVLEVNRATQAVALATVDSVWVRQKSTRKGALIGGIVGAVALTGLTFALRDDTCETDDGCDDDNLNVLIFGIGIGGGGGLLVGAGLGSLVKRWVRQYP